MCAGFKISSYYREAEGQSTVKGREVAIKRQPARHHCHGDLTRRAPLITVPVAAEQVSLPVSPTLSCSRPVPRVPTCP